MLCFFSPVVAVYLSDVFEGFVWTDSVIIGFAMVLLGNFIALTPVDKLARLTGRKSPQTD
jgi:hypothetical protein